MATNRTDWLPTPKSRICDKHFNNDEYKGGDKNNELKQNARPTLNTSSNVSLMHIKHIGRYFNHFYL